MRVGHQAGGHAVLRCCHQGLGSPLGDCGGRDGQVPGIDESRSQHDAGRDLREDGDEAGCSGLLRRDHLVAAQALPRADESDRVIRECAVVADQAARARGIGGSGHQRYDWSGSVAGRGEDQGPDIADSEGPITDLEGGAAVVDEGQIVVAV